MPDTYPQETGTTPASKIHIWILILLVWTAVFAMIAVGLILTKSSAPSISQSSIALACQNGAMNGITTNLTRISDACLPSGDDQSESVSGPTYDAADSRGYLPKVVLPLHWSGNVFMNFAKDVTLPYARFHATKGIAFGCNECGGVSAPAEFTVTGNDLLPAHSALMDVAKLQSDYAANAAQYTQITVTSESVSNGTLVHIDGIFTPDGVVAHAGQFHILRFANTTKFVELTFYEDHGATNAEWELVKASLDWSTVK